MADKAPSMQSSPPGSLDQWGPLHIDLESPFGGFFLLSVMLWPFALARRREFLVTVAAKMLHRVGLAFGADLDKKLRVLAAQVADLTGLSAEQVQAELQTRAWAPRAAMASAFYGEIDQHLFRPYGGFDGVADAIGTEAIMKIGRQDGRKYGAACGEALAYVIMLREHHRELVGMSGRPITPSINLGLHIMGRRAQEEGRTLPAKRHRKSMWKKWGPVAPLWTASAFCETAVKALGARPCSYHDRGLRREIVATSLWIANFATNYRPAGSSVRLLQEDSVIKLQCGLKALKPDIPPLSDALLAHACAYSSDDPDW